MKGGEANDDLREVEHQILEEDNKKRLLSTNNKTMDIEFGNRSKNKSGDINSTNFNENHEINMDNVDGNHNDTLQNDDEYGDDPKGKKRSQRHKISDFSILTRAFIMTFISEVGDRSQIATVVLAAHKNPYGVTFGASSGHAICTGLAVIGGKLLASRISEKKCHCYWWHFVLIIWFRMFY